MLKLLLAAGDEAAGGRRLRSIEVEEGPVVCGRVWMDEIELSSCQCQSLFDRIDRMTACLGCGAEQKAKKGETALSVVRSLRACLLPPPLLSSRAARALTWLRAE